MTALSDLVQRFENSSGNPYMGTGGTDLISYITSGNVDQYGFPLWPGISTPSGMSTSAGNYGFTRTTWDAYAPQAGVNSFSPQDQLTMFNYVSNQPNGMANWTCCDPPLAAALRSSGASITGVGAAIMPAAPAGVASATAMPVGAGGDFGGGSDAASLPWYDKNLFAPGYTSSGDLFKPYTSNDISPAQAMQPLTAATGGGVTPGIFAEISTWIASKAANVVLGAAALALLIVAIWPDAPRQALQAAKDVAVGAIAV